jgi:hypothetical protein
MFPISTSAEECIAAKDSPRVAPILAPPKAAGSSGGTSKQSSSGRTYTGTSNSASPNFYKARLNQKCLLPPCLPERIKRMRLLERKSLRQYLILHPILISAELLVVRNSLAICFIIYRARKFFKISSYQIIGLYHVAHSALRAA